MKGAEIPYLSRQRSLNLQAQPRSENIRPPKHSRYHVATQVTQQRREEK
jgi:hypothetical protein